MCLNFNVTVKLRPYSSYYYVCYEEVKSLGLTWSIDFYTLIVVVMVFPHLRKKYQEIIILL